MTLSIAKSVKIACRKFFPGIRYSVDFNRIEIPQEDEGPPTKKRKANNNDTEKLVLHTVVCMHS